MRVAELIAVRQLRLVERAISGPAPGEVQVRVHAVGVCGSDLHYYREGGIGETRCIFPMVLGHEPAGTVVRVGTGVTGWAPGDRVAMEPAVYCYHCEFCRTGRRNVCANIGFLGQPGQDGFFRDNVNLPAANLLPLSNNLSFHQGTMVEPLAVALHSMQFVSLQAGETAAVFGAGPIGLMTIAVLKLAGASRIWAVEPVSHRRRMALEMGADAALDPSAVDPATQIRADTRKRGVDVAIDCATKGDSVNQCLRAVRNAGRVVITGIPTGARVDLEFHQMRRKELALFNVRRSNREPEKALQLLCSQPARFAPIITHVQPLEQIGPAFCMLEQYADGVGKLVIEMG